MFTSSHPNWTTQEKNLLYVELLLKEKMLSVISKLFSVRVAPLRYGEGNTILHLIPTHC